LGITGVCKMGLNVGQTALALGAIPTVRNLDKIAGPCKNRSTTDANSARGCLLEGVLVARSVRDELSDILQLFRGAGRVQLAA
jgi:hypothetical protein